MSHQSKDPEPPHPHSTTDHLDNTVAGEDERWDIKPGMTDEDIIALRHLRPGEAVPDWFEQCDFCAGAGCYACDDAGRLHPVRADSVWHCIVDHHVQDDHGQWRYPRWVEREMEQARAGKRKCRDVAANPPRKWVV